MQQNDPVKDPIQQNNPAKICPTCFHENAGDARFCTNCNKRLPGKAITQPASPPKNESPAGPPDQIASPQMPDELSVVRKVPFPKQRLQPNKGPLVLIALVLALVTVSFLVFMALKIKNGSGLVAVTPTATHIPPTLPGVGEVKNANGHSIGVNDGSFAPFDVGRQDQVLKQQAANALKEGNSSAAVSLWHQALTINSNDAEALIYIEDQRVLASGESHITLIAGTAFTPPFPDVSSNSDLQGVYVAQHEFNTHNHGFQVRVLIANSGDHAPDTTAIAQQIVRIAQKDPTVVGVIGWRYSSYSLLAISVLANAKVPIPLISPQSTSDELTAISPYFFRVVAPNSEEVQIAAPFAEKTLGFKHPVIFFDPQDSYSQNLAQGFSDRFKKDGYIDIHEEAFTTDAKNQQANFSELIQNAAQYQPDGFIFTGRSNADSGFFQDALPTSGPMTHINVLAGSGSYTAHKNSHGRWYFIAVAYHGASNTTIAQQFADDYRKDFSDSNQNHIYYYKLADDHAMVAYDATALTLQAILNTGKTNPTPEDLARELPNIKGANAFQDVSGQIAFGSNGNPINKTLFILFVPSNGQIQQVAVCSINSGCHS